MDSDGFRWMPRLHFFRAPSHKFFERSQRHRIKGWVRTCCPDSPDPKLDQIDDANMEDMFYTYLHI